MKEGILRMTSSLESSSLVKLMESVQSWMEVNSGKSIHHSHSGRCTLKHDVTTLTEWPIININHLQTIQAFNLARSKMGEGIAAYFHSRQSPTILQAETTLGLFLTGVVIIEAIRTDWNALQWMQSDQQQFFSSFEAIGIDLNWLQFRQI